MKEIWLAWIDYEADADGNLVWISDEPEPEGFKEWASGNPPKPE
jgi:hypothetical protein